ncbi:thermonuclease family protein [Reyranella sp. CPCC 100927]|uniref:thermonuclease family protein n=1 Tax=Reyranella sp. CPCC 100927 TaxID=2599616 RepID=UPI0015B63952|nr:thermonuclease family protein [Reyranella sp. CPCC 100927]
MAVAMLAAMPAYAGEWSGVPLVIDGGTIVINGQRLRLAGLDAPDNAQICQGPDNIAYDCGVEARRALAVIIASRDVRCSGDRRDRYRRPLVTCQIGETDIGRELVRLGWAMAAQSSDYGVEEDDARAQGRGLWQGPFQRPDDWRRARAMLPSGVAPKE